MIYNRIRHRPHPVGFSIAICVVASLWPWQAHLVLLLTDSSFNCCQEKFSTMELETFPVTEPRQNVTPRVPVFVLEHQPDTTGIFST
tara:strand:- start:2804 stop:3064 length:261 start_codon:yes stop_codon:yes gene_type:complete